MVELGGSAQLSSAYIHCCVYNVGWNSAAAFTSYFPNSSDFKIFASKIMPYLTKPPAPICFHTKSASARSPEAALWTFSASSFVEIILTEIDVYVVAAVDAFWEKFAQGVRGKR